NTTAECRAVRGADTPSERIRSTMGSAKFSAAKAPPSRPARVMATWMVARNLAGCLVRFSSRPARLSPSSERIFSLASLIEITAISELANSALTAIRTIWMINAPIIINNSPFSLHDWFVRKKAQSAACKSADYALISSTDSSQCAAEKQRLPYGDPHPNRLPWTHRTSRSCKLSPLYHRRRRMSTCIQVWAGGSVPPIPMLRLVAGEDHPGVHQPEGRPCACDPGCHQAGGPAREGRCQQRQAQQDEHPAIGHIQFGHRAVVALDVGHFRRLGRERNR